MDKDEIFKRNIKQNWAKYLLFTHGGMQSFTQIVRIFFLAQPDCYENVEKARQALKRALDLAVDFLYEVCEENRIEEPRQ